MTIFEQIFLEFGVDIWGMVKWLFVLAFLVYLMFALIAWRQIELMIKTLDGSLALPIRALGIGLTVIAGVSLILALVIL